MDTEKKRRITNEKIERFPRILTSDAVADMLGPFAQGLGYQQLILEVKDPPTEKILHRLNIYRKPEELEQFINALFEFAAPPDELLQQIPFRHLAPDGTKQFGTTVGQLLKKQNLGGRKRDLDYDHCATRIKDEGTKAAFDREYEKWVASEFPDGQYTSGERELFVKAMNLRGVHYRKLE